jgi:hypothetical protein
MTISPNSDVDMFKFTAKAGQRIGFDVDRTTGSTLDSYIRLFNAAGTQILTNNNGFAPGEPINTAESYFEWTFPTAGTYYLGVSALPNTKYDPVAGSGDVAGSSGGGYKLTLTDRTASDWDDQLSEGVAATVGGPVITGAIAPSGDVDVYKFTVTAGQKVGFDIDRPSGSLDSYLRLFNVSGVQLASNDNAAAPGETLGKSSYLTFKFTTAGTYYIAVSGVPNRTYNALTGFGDLTAGASSIGAYMLRLANVA